jgi:hypothetical protein
VRYQLGRYIVENLLALVKRHPQRADISLHIFVIPQIVLIATRLDLFTPIWHYFSMKSNNQNAYSFDCYTAVFVRAKMQNYKCTVFKVPVPPEGPPPAARRPTPTLRSRWLASITPPGALDVPTVELTI